MIMMYPDLMTQNFKVKTFIERNRIPGVSLDSNAVEIVQDALRIAAMDLRNNALSLTSNEKWSGVVRQFRARADAFDALAEAIDEHTY